MTFALPPLPPAVSTLTTVQSQRLRQTYPGLAQSPKDCITCKGRKTFRWYAPIDQRDTVGEYACPCADQFVLHRRLLHAGIHETYQRLGWVDFEHIPEDAMTMAFEYLDNYEAFISAGFGMVIHGDKGNGKTLLGNLIGKDLVGKGVDVYANTFASMIDSFADGWRDKEDRQWFAQRVRNAEVLLIDDLFRERNKGVGTVGENALEETLRHRVARSKPTIITMNPEPDKVEGAYGAHVVSLLTEKAMIYQFHGKDRRPEMNSRFRNEVLSGMTRPVVLA